MPIAFACDGCGTKYKVADTFAGKRVKCKKCGHAISVPAPVSAAVDGGTDLRFKDDDAPTTRPVAPRPAPAKPTTRPAAARPGQPARPAQTPVPGTTRPAAARPVARRPAPPPPPQDNSLEDLAALAQGELLPPEEMPAAEAYVPPTPAPARPAVTRGPQLGYATPRKTVLEQPAYISANGGFLIMALFIAPVINAIIRVIALASNAPAGASINFGALLFGLVVGLGISAIFLCFVAAILLVGIKIAGAIMKFSTEPGGFRNVLMILGWPAALGVLSTLIGLIIPEGAMEVRVVLACIFIGLMLFGMVKLLKDTFVITWAQTAVAAVMAIGSVIAVILLIALAVGTMIGGLSKYL